MSVAAAVMSAAPSSSSILCSLHSNRCFTSAAIARSSITAALPEVAATHPNPVAVFRPLVAITRLPPPAGTAGPLFLPLTRNSSVAAAASYASATTYGDEEGSGDEEWQTSGDDEGYSDEEWQNGGPAGDNRTDGQKKKGANEAGRLYVGNLPFSMTEAQLEEVFKEAGPVRSVEVVYDRVTDRSRGFAFVTMAGAEEAKEAIRLFDGSQVGGRTVKVNFPEVPRGGEREVMMGPRTRGVGGPGSSRFVESPHKVYAGNLGWSVTSETLGRAMEGLPGFQGARVIYERDTGRSRGYGFVSFASQEDAQSAIDSMNGVELEGRPLRLSPSTGKPAKASTPSSPE